MGAKLTTKETAVEETAASIQKKIGILRRLDVDAWIEISKGNGLSPSTRGWDAEEERDIALIAIHKCRVEVTELTNEERLASIEWLRERGFGRLGLRPLPAPGVIPT